MEQVLTVNYSGSKGSYGFEIYKKFSGYSQYHQSPRGENQRRRRVQIFNTISAIILDSIIAIGVYILVDCSRTWKAYIWDYGMVTHSWL